MKKLLRGILRLFYVYGGAIIAYYGVYWSVFFLYYKGKFFLNDKNYFGKRL